MSWMTLTLFIPAATAGPLGYVMGTASGASQYRQPGQVGTCSYGSFTDVTGGCTYQDTGTLPYNSSDGKLWAGTGNSYTASISSSVDTNGLHAKASLSMINDPVDIAGGKYWGSNPGDAMASATWEDTITILGAPGSSVQLLFSFMLDGVLSASSHALANAYVDWSAYDQTTKQNANSSWTYSTISAYGPPIPSFPMSGQSLTVSAGDTISISLRLRAYASVGCSAISGSMLCNAGSTADLSNTLSFSSIAFTDDNDNPVPGFSIGSSNGFDYNQFSSSTTTSAPEPLTALQVLTPLAVLLWKRRQGLRP
jgi:hypothetical protein